MSNKPKVLLVDDEPKNVKYLKRKLESEGVQVIAAYSGQDCLDIVDTDTPNLILLDVMMPKMDGIEVFKQVKKQERTNAIPIIFITVVNAEAGKFKEIGITASDLITKPIDLNNTVNRVKSRLLLQEFHS